MTTKFGSIWNGKYHKGKYRVSILNKKKIFISK